MAQFGISRDKWIEHGRKVPLVNICICFLVFCLETLNVVVNVNPLWTLPISCCFFFLLVLFSDVLHLHSFPSFYDMPFLSSSVPSACCMLLRARTKRRIMKWMTLIRVEHLWLTGERSSARSPSTTPPLVCPSLPSPPPPWCGLRYWKRFSHLFSKTTWADSIIKPE